MFENTEDSSDLKDFKTLSSQKFFSQSCEDNKFFENLNKSKSRVSKDEKTDEKFPKKEIFPVENLQFTPKNSSLSNSESDWNFLFRKKSKNNIDDQKVWKCHKYKDLLFNRETTDSTFIDHLMEVWKTVLYMRKYIKEPKEEVFQKKEVCLYSIGK